MSGTQPTSLANLAKGAGDLLVQSAKLGANVLGALRLPRHACACTGEIPPPCWVPKHLGDLNTGVCPGGAAVLRLNITNCGNEPRQIAVSATDVNAKIEPPAVTLGRYEQTTIVVSVDTPATSSPGQRRQLIVWIQGCREHYLRWTIDVATSNANCSTDVAVEDCPDLIHHWYDHFYCERPCQHGHGDHGRGG